MASDTLSGYPTSYPYGSDAGEDYADTISGDDSYTGGDSSIYPPPVDPVTGQPVEDDFVIMPTEPCPLEHPPEPEPTITIRSGLYFDGTGNNRANTTTRKQGNTPMHIRWKWRSSYENDYSNVAKLEYYATNYFDADHTIKIYVQGIGTTEGIADTLPDQAFGTGMTGVPARVYEGKREMIAQAKALSDDNGGALITRKDFDAFGFSRGAAAARHYIWQCFRGPRKAADYLAAKATPGAVFNAKFAGLYDTVAAFGAFDHTNDVEQLGLNAIEECDYTVHLAAAEENRQNFSLNPIDKATGLEVFLPGVHSDIGGGYNLKAKEEKFRLYVGGYFKPYSKRFDALHEDRSWLIAQGWYAPGDLKIHTAGCVVMAQRKTVFAYYTRIPLHLMAHYAAEWDIYMSNKINHPVNGAVHDTLQKWYDDLLAYAEETRSAGGGSHPNDWISRRDVDMKWLRYNHLHFSSNYEALDAMGPLFIKEGGRIAKRWRHYYPPLPGGGA